MQTLRDQVRVFERQLIERAVIDANGDEKAAARQLGLELWHLKIKRKRPVVEPTQGRTSSEEPFAWALRWNGDRFELGACWTVNELTLEVRSLTTAALYCQHADACHMLREMNTTVAIRAAIDGHERVG